MCNAALEDKRIIQIRTFGGFSMHIDGQCVGLQKWQNRRVHQLLAALVALGGQQVSVTHLADMLWPNTEGDKALQNIEFNLRTLRRVLHEMTDKRISGCEIITLHQGKLSLNDHHCMLDTWLWACLTLHADRLRCQQQEAEQAFAMEKRALNLIQGDFLANEHEFIAAPRNGWRQQLSGWMAELAYTWRHCELANFDDVMKLVEIGLSIDPCSERLCIRAMYTLSDKGYSVDAARLYYDWAERIKEQYGLNPSPKAAALARQIISGND